MPSKSGIVGLLAAAQGRRRTDPLESLLNLSLAVRIDQEGGVEQDFQTSSRMGERTPVSVSRRQYLTDAVFLAAVDGDSGLLSGLSEALRRPHFPLYLGRRSCPVSGRIDLGLRDGSAVEALRAEPWHAASWFRRKWRRSSVELVLVADCRPGTEGEELIRDQPVEGGFDPRHRQWEWRTVLRHPLVEVDNPDFAGRSADETDPHDPMAELSLCS
jgi:CRISPR system Cascade subunit CasD